MTTAHIYMDDFVLYEAQSSRTLGDALGYVAAIVDDEADSAITRYIDALAATLQRQFRLSTQPYFHAKDIIAGRDGWQALSVFERAAVIHDVIHEAVGAGALLVYELVHEADEGFRRVREQLQTEVRRLQSRIEELEDRLVSVTRRSKDGEGGRPAHEDDDLDPDADSES